MAANRKPVFPKAVLDMKFMKKTKERIENTEDIDLLYSSSITKEMRQASGNFITESSFIVCVDLVEGRLSFKGMNAEIERLMELEYNEKNPQIESEMQKDVSDDILSKKIESLRKRKWRASPGKSEIKRRRR